MLRCQSCGAACAGTFRTRLRCAACRSRRPAFKAARAPLPYAGAARKLIHAYKYQSRSRLGAWIAKRMARMAVEELPIKRIDCIVPVPSHWSKRCFREIDIPAAIAKRLSAQLKKPCTPTALRRRRWTKSQTRLGVKQRMRNVSGAFEANAHSVRGQGVLLVDDVLTSGATAQTCSKTLLSAGAREVFVLTAARTPFRSLRGHGTGDQGPENPQ